MPTEVHLNLGKPNIKQAMFLEEQHKVVAFGGARGGGKSWAVRTKAVLLCLKHCGITLMIVRKTYPELTANHIDPLIKLLRCRLSEKERIASYNKTDKVMSFPNGSRILFRYCDTEADADRYQGTEVDVLFIDEGTMLSWEQYTKLTACVRGANHFPKRIYITCNPGGIGHQWVKRLFIDRKYEESERPEDYAFIQSLAYDNDALLSADPDYIAKLEALPPRLRKMWLDGSFDVFEGQYFEEFADDPKHYTDRRYTHVIEPFDIPKDWKIYRSFDWGYFRPFSAGYWAVDYDGVIYRILELYGCTKEPNTGVKWIPDKVFAEMRRLEDEHPWLRGRTISGVADPAIWDASRGESIAETALKYRIYFEPGDNKRLPGWLQMRYRLAFDDHGLPMMYIFKNCKAFIRTIPLMMFSETKPEDLDTELEDHVADETRYFCMSRPIKPVIKKINKPVADDPLNMMTDLKKNPNNPFRRL